MPKIIFGTHHFHCKDNENLLDAFFRNKVDIPFSCRNGTCHACVTKVVSGKICEPSQSGLSKQLKESNHILPCRCYPEGDMVLSPPLIEDIFSQAKVTSIEELSETIFSVSFKPDAETLEFKTGQFVNIRTKLDNKVRSYSITNHFQGSESIISIHVKRIDSGVFSQWVFENANIGDEIQVQYPLGASYVTHDNSVTGKLLIASGSGLGAAYAIAKASLNDGYDKVVHLVHVVKSEEDLYYLEELKNLSNQYPNFQFEILTDNDSSECVDSIFGKFGLLENWEVYLYGNPKLVKASIQTARNKGVQEEKIISDAFEYAQIPEYFQSEEDSNKMEFVEEEKRQFTPDIEMWKALGEGKLLNQILNDFYDKVLADDLLSPFFKGVTKSHIVGKQYAFLNQVFTGKDCYFGDRPRNAHHWMIISDKLFNYREKLFADSCIKFGFKEPFLSQMLELNESYRAAIVKTRMWPRIDKGEVKPIKGYEEMILDIGGICDGCHKELSPGEKVHYHDLTGEMFCNECRG